MPIITVEGGRLRVMHGECPRCEAVLTREDVKHAFCWGQACVENIRYRCEDGHYFCEKHIKKGS